MKFPKRPTKLLGECSMYELGKYILDVEEAKEALREFLEDIVKAKKQHVALAKCLLEEWLQ